MFICYRSHYASNSKTVKIIIYKYQHTKKYRCKLCSYSCFNMFSCPFTKCSRTASPVHHAYHNSQYNKKYKNSYIIRIRKNSKNSVIKYMKNRFFQAESRLEKIPIK